MRKRLFPYLILGLILCVNLPAQYRYSYLQMGQKELAEEHYHKAIGYLTYYIKSHPGIFKGYYFRGLAKYYLADLHGAETDFTDAIRCLPQYPQLYLLRGIVRSENFKMHEAISDFDTALQHDSLFTSAYFYRSLTHMNLRELELAFNDIDRVIELDDKYTNAYILRGAVFSELEFYQEAISDFTVSLERNPENTKAMVQRGRVYANTQETDMAMADFNVALTLDSLNAQALFYRGITYIDIMEFEKALADLNRVIELSPDNELAYFNRAVISHNQNLNSDAIDDYLNILHRNPDNLLVYYNMGLSFARLGQHAQAIKCFSTAIAIYPDYADAYLQRAMIAKELGDIGAAERDYDIYEQLSENNLTKNDSIKQAEGIEILRLTHLSGEFIAEKEKKNLLQYLETDIDLQAPYQMLFDTLFISDNFNNRNDQLSYYLQSEPLLSEIDSIELDIEPYLFTIDSLRNNGMPPTKYYQLRALIHMRAGGYVQAVSDFDTALSYNPANIEVLFNRANARMSVLYTSPTHVIENNQASSILLMFSDILHDLNKVLILQPDFIYARYNIAYLKYLMEDYTGALEEFTAVTKEHRIAEAHYNKGLLEHYFNNSAVACIELGIAGELGLEEAYSAIRKFCK